MFNRGLSVSELQLVEEEAWEGQTTLQASANHFGALLVDTAFDPQSL